MPVLGNAVEIPIDVDGDRVVFSFPAYQDENFRKGITKLLKTRFVLTNDGDTKNSSYEARSVFFDNYVTGVPSNNLYVDVEETIPLNPDTPQQELQNNNVNSWVELIPDNWKAEISSHFEESAVKAKRSAEKE